MKNKKLLLLAICLVLFGLLLAGCSVIPQKIKPTATRQPATRMPPPLPPTAEWNLPAPKTVTMPISDSWDLVVLGDSEAFGFGEYYAAAIKADLGIQQVNFLDRWKGGLTTGQLLKLLRSDQQLRAELSQAEVITFEANPTDAIGWYIVDGEGKFDCSTQALTAYKTDLDAITAELFSLRKGQPTIFRAMDFYCPIYSWWKEWGCYENCKACWEAFNATIRVSASEHGIPVAGVYERFNGPQGGEDPLDKGYIGSDGEHTSIEGQKVMAEAFRKTGYMGIVP